MLTENFLFDLLTWPESQAKEIKARRFKTFSHLHSQLALHFGILGCLRVVYLPGFKFELQITPRRLLRPTNIRIKRFRYHVYAPLARRRLLSCQFNVHFMKMTDSICIKYLYIPLFRVEIPDPNELSRISVHFRAYLELCAWLSKIKIISTFAAASN